MEMVELIMGRGMSVEVRSRGEGKCSQDGGNVSAAREPEKIQLPCEKNPLSQM